MTNTIVEIRIQLRENCIDVHVVEGASLIETHGHPLELTDVPGERKASLLNYIYAALTLFIRSQGE